MTKAVSWTDAQTGLLAGMCILAAAVLGGRWALGSSWPARPQSRVALLKATDLQVDVNEADWVQFSLLPEVGAKKARRIVELRERLGRFRSLDELERVRGISHRILFKIRPHLILEEEADGDAPEAPPDGR